MELWEFPHRGVGRPGNEWRSTMGDKGGRKDKAKGQKQNVSKQKKEAQNKKDKQPKRKP